MGAAKGFDAKALRVQGRRILDVLAPEVGEAEDGLNPHRMGLAFAEYIRRYPADRLPYAGGVSATVVVTMTLETLIGGLKAAQLDTGTPITLAHHDDYQLTRHPGGKVTFTRRE